MFDIESAKAFLERAQIFFGCDDDEDDPRWAQTINLNDVLYWASSDAQYVEDSELPRVADLFWRYGFAGVVYWVVVEKRGDESPEFCDIKRFIEFVAKEEAIRKEEPSCSKRAYLKRTYTLGE